MSKLLKSIATLVLLSALSTASFSDTVQASSSKIQLQFENTGQHFVILSKGNQVVYTEVTQSETLTICNLESGNYYDIIIADENQNVNEYSVRTNDTY